MLVCIPSGIFLSDFPWDQGSSVCCPWLSSHFLTFHLRGGFLYLRDLQRVNTQSNLKKMEDLRGQIKQHDQNFTKDSRKIPNLATMCKQIWHLYWSGYFQNRNIFRLFQFEKFGRTPLLQIQNQTNEKSSISSVGSTVEQHKMKISWQRLWKSASVHCLISV